MGGIRDCREEDWRLMGRGWRQDGRMLVVGGVEGVLSLKA